MHRSISSPATIPQWEVFEVSLKTAATFDNPFRDAQATAEFVSPTGESVTVEGFYYGGDEWRVRFVPRQPGEWRYRAVLRGGESLTEQAGTFNCQGAVGHGFLRLSRRNPYRLEHEDGTPFYPVGVQTGSFLRPDCDGPNADGSGRWVENEQWLECFAGAVNLVRTQFGQGMTEGCALPIIPKGGPADRYDTELAAKIDAAYFAQRRAGMAQILIPMQDMSLWDEEGKWSTAFGPVTDLVNYKSTRAANLPLQEQYLRYVVARYGCFVDIWEIFNEDSFAPDDYLAHLAKVIREADPYQHPITTNYARPQADWCEIVTFHEYMGMPASEVDLYLASQFALYKSYGKVVQNTEFGNQRFMPNVDPIKWRIATWTAFLHECGLLFWSMSHRKYEKHGECTRCNANAYLGPDTRKHLRILNEFTRDLPIDLRPVSVGFTKHKDIRLYGLSNGQVSVIYAHHFPDHQSVYERSSPLMIQIGPGRFRARWIDPEDGSVVRTDEYENRQQYLNFNLPPVQVDLAARIERIG